MGLPLTLLVCLWYMVDADLIDKGWLGSKHRHAPPSGRLRREHPCVSWINFSPEPWLRGWICRWACRWSRHLKLERKKSKTKIRLCELRRQLSAFR